MFVEDCLKQQRLVMETYPVTNEHCANRNMDKWEDENLRPQDRRQPRVLYCPCSRCNPISC